MIVRPLAPAEWHLVADDFTRQFETTMPESAEQSQFWGVFLGDEFIGFAHLEKAFHLNAVYIKPEHREKRLTEGIFDVLDNEIPAKYPLLIFPYKDVKSILKKYGFTDKGTIPVYRKEY